MRFTSQYIDRITDLFKFGFGALRAIWGSWKVAKSLGIFENAVLGNQGHQNVLKCTFRPAARKNRGVGCFSLLEQGGKKKERLLSYSFDQATFACPHFTTQVPNEKLK